ncbi:MAG: response regulator transcription factor [Burkholderiaceae bacterium]
MNIHARRAECSVVSLRWDAYAGEMNHASKTHSILRLLLADDHEMVRVAIRHALSALAPSIEWREAADAPSVEAELARCDDVDLALVDLHMPGAGAVTWIAGLRQRHPTVPLIVLSGDENPSLVRSLIGQGIAGFIPKSDTSTVIFEAVRLVLAGGTYAPLRLMGCADFHEESASRIGVPARAAPHGLTDRQFAVLRLLARGLPNKLIARELDISESTVKVHLLAIFRTLGVHNRTQAVMAAQKKLRADGQAAETPGVPGSLCSFQ